MAGYHVKPKASWGWQFLCGEIGACPVSPYRSKQGDLCLDKFPILISLIETFDAFSVLEVMNFLGKDQAGAHEGKGLQPFSIELRRISGS